MRLFILVFSCWCFAFSCFAYDIEPYSKIESATESDKAFNLVFCSLHYSDSQHFLNDIEILIQRLNKTKPFNEFMDTIRIWRMDISKGEETKIFKPAQGFPPLKVRRDFLDYISTHLKTNYKLVIIDALGSVSCAELSSVNRMSLIILGKRRYKNSNSFAKGFLHELGHSLGLRDECVDCSELCPPGPPNCATTKQEAKKWWGDLVGKNSRVNYIRGCCGSKDYTRPTIASLMNNPDKAEDFGTVNERYLRKSFQKE